MNRTVNANDAGSVLETSDLDFVSRQLPSIGCPPPGRIFDVELAVVTDHVMCSKFGNDIPSTANHILSRLYLASIPFTYQTCVLIRIPYFEIHCNSRKDPYYSYSLFPAQRWLTYFSRYWNRERKYVRRDAAIYLPGYTDSNGGRPADANFERMCSRTEGYGWVEEANAPLITQRIGQLLGASHVDQGVMRTQPNMERQFNVGSICRISAFIANRGKSGCLRDSSPQLTCALGFSSPRNMVACSRSFLSVASRPFASTLLGTVYFIQGNGTFSVEVVAATDATIQWAGVHASLRDDVNDLSVEKRMIELEPAQRTWKTDISWNSIER